MESSDKNEITQFKIELTEISNNINFEFKDGVPNHYGKIDGEYIDFREVTVQALENNQLLIRNKSPRNFKQLTVISANHVGVTKTISAFTDYIFSYVMENYNDELSPSFILGELPNPAFNVKVSGFWSDTNPSYGFFTKKQKEQLTRTLVEVRYIINQKEYKSALAARLGNDLPTAERILVTLTSATRVTRAFMLATGHEGVSAGDWFAIHQWRYGHDLTNLMSTLLADTALHEVAHTLGFDDGGQGSYPIGYAAADVLAQYYKEGRIVKDQPIYE
ncbi:Uncharacterised protein [Serratia quinivorans]|uniref:hypothetical protein n=1 Tax=Serratia quinivorans TaxID=137545 RepID=UPI002178D774|nr:hypothetical protein [Serratia quinivorans]CAI0802385.1 Uncharacterised protein [Serratia quinivorans]CAI1747332.1 Uncharacterised protein [Serratia quinivorans]CAI1833050.1 Uncharacterised protein [Serratia quinivorans]CAI2060613.1 Uncharacterised protein [Serratia quinivorans]CAI2086140.1 Uncharacterised protein [Serratia quinivorans]